MGYTKWLVTALFTTQAITQVQLEVSGRARVALWRCPASSLIRAVLRPAESGMEARGADYVECSQQVRDGVAQLALHRRDEGQQQR